MAAIAMMAVIVASVVAAITAAARLWKAGEFHHVAAANRATYIPVKFAAAALELDVVEVNNEATRADLANAQVIVDVYIAEAGAVALALDDASALTHRIAAKLAGLPWALAIAVIAVIAAIASAPAVIADGDIERRVSDTKECARDGGCVTVRGLIRESRGGCEWESR